MGSKKLTYKKKMAPIEKNSQMNPIENEVLDVIDVLEDKLYVLVSYDDSALKKIIRYGSAEFISNIIKENEETEYKYICFKVISNKMTLEEARLERDKRKNRLKKMYVAKYNDIKKPIYL